MKVLALKQEWQKSFPDWEIFLFTHSNVMGRDRCLIITLCACVQIELFIRCLTWRKKKKGPCVCSRLHQHVLWKVVSISCQLSWCIAPTGEAAWVVLYDAAASQGSESIAFWKHWGGVDRIDAKEMTKPALRSQSLESSKNCHYAELWVHVVTWATHVKKQTGLYEETWHLYSKCCQRVVEEAT